MNLGDKCFPRFFPVRQKFRRPREEDIPGAVARELERVFAQGCLSAGAQIGVTVGSRGIASLAVIVRAACDFIRERGAQPFIIPAMGSHGGATGEAQRRLIAHYGVTEEAMGAPVRDSMETRSLGRTVDDVEVYFAETAWQADGVLLLNRVKPHTDFKGRIESGLAKICAIGLGKLDGAREIHRHIFDIGLGDAIVSVARTALASGKIVGGVAVLENGYHETARIAGVTLDGFLEQEMELIEEARTLMPRLPLQQLDVLLCQRMGKNVSGSGLDTNLTGRSVYGYFDGKPWRPGMPEIWRVVVLDLSDESDGNAVGMGQVDFATRRFEAKVDRRVTSLNAITSCAPMGAKMPAILEHDLEALSVAIRTSPPREHGPRIAYVKDTLELEAVWLSEACLPEVEDRSDVEIVGEPRPLEFSADGQLTSPFA